MFWVIRAFYVIIRHYISQPQHYVETPRHIIPLQQSCFPTFARVPSQMLGAASAAAAGRRFTRHRSQRLIVARIASPEMFPEAEMLPHLICSRPIFIGGAND